MSTPFQATCVALAGRAVLIEGKPGTGNSSLALALIDRGAVLVGDDGVMLCAEAGRLIARPHPATRTLLEIRNLGLLAYPVCEAAPVALVLTLSADAPRYIEAAERVTRAGILLPHIALWPDSPVLALRALAALDRHGLSFTD